jgi:hypothetical protein
LPLCSSHLPLGVPNWAASTSNKHFFGAVAGEKEDFCKGSLSLPIFLLCYCFAYFILFAFFIKNTKNSSFYSCYFLLVCFYLARMNNPENTKLCDFTSTSNNDFICTPIVPPAPDTTFYEIKPALLNLVMKEQFFGVNTDDAAAHLNNFVELCEMQKYKDVDEDIIKLKLFPFFLRGRAKNLLLSLPRNSIDSWVKCKDSFIGKYYSPAKIISLRNDIMKFKHFDDEHVAQAWERMKSLIKNCPTDYLDDYPNLLCRTKFFFKKSLGFSCWRYLYVHHLGRCNKAP